MTWSTPNYTKSEVEFGFFKEHGDVQLKFTTKGSTKEFISRNEEKSRKQFIHYVKLKGLQPGKQYVYHVGSDLGWSELFFFRTAPNNSHWSPKVAIYGDMGNENPKSLPFLQDDVQTGNIDCILHIGDFAYDLDSEVGRRGDEFLRQIEAVAAYVPYMTCAGNHEERHNFSEYRNRFNMPGGERGSFYYSFDLGPIHFVSINTEMYYFTAWGGLKLVEEQYEWLEEDLQKANLPENRQLRPWVIIFGHRPMYCSNKKKRDCSVVNTKTRVGLQGGFFGLEELLYTNQVDLAFWGHQHSYERMFPMFNYTILNGSKEAPYVNPRATVHVTSGSAGCKEEMAPFSKKKPAWSAFRSIDYGYTRLHAANHTHLYWEQVSADKKGGVIDKVWIVKDQIHFPPELCSACLV